jgi:hypothetical protein
MSKGRTEGSGERARETETEEESEKEGTILMEYQFSGAEDTDVVITQELICYI